MGTVEDPFEPLIVDEAGDDFAVLSRKPAGTSQVPTLMAGGAATGRLHGFDLDDRPLVAGLDALPGQIIAARTTVALRRHMVGSAVVILYEGGNLQLPIIVGVVQQPSVAVDEKEGPMKQVAIDADDDRYVISAEREIVLRCGDSSITLTRAGKVIIKGNYILSRSTGYNKIKGAAVDIN